MKKLSAERVRYQAMVERMGRCMGELQEITSERLKEILEARWRRMASEEKTFDLHNQKYYCWLQVVALSSFMPRVRAAIFEKTIPLRPLNGGSQYLRNVYPFLGGGLCQNFGLV